MECATRVWIEPIQFNCFNACARLYNSLSHCNLLPSLCKPDTEDLPSITSSGPGKLLMFIRRCFVIQTPVEIFPLVLGK
eukprot:417805-Pelagomonas_calceolata.AAC.1